MKLVFIFPFKQECFGTPLKWLPLGAPTLIGNIKKDFPGVIFDQLDLEEEIKSAVARKKLDGRRLQALNRLLENNILTNEELDKDLNEFRSFFSSLADYLNLGKYDHYFFSVYTRGKVGIKANILLAKYLKKRYKNKKIIFGGTLGFFGENYEKCSFEKFDFIDSTVIGTGENSAKEILNNLLMGKRLEKIYRIDTPRRFRLAPPDYSRFKSIKHFSYLPEDLEKIYGINLPRSRVGKRILFIPYKFSSGCFWSKCSFCGQSDCHKTKNSFFCKDVNEIIDDLRALKETNNTKYFLFLNNNFNFDLEFSKKLLKAIIKNKLDILWTDSFNLAVIDGELLDLLADAGCFRACVGTSIIDPKLQKLYHCMLRNHQLKYVKEMSRRGIWTHINIIVNLPHQYSIKKDKEILSKYMPDIDTASVFNYIRVPYSDLGQNYEKYNLKLINKKTDLIIRESQSVSLAYIEKDFTGTLSAREELIRRNYLEMKNFFIVNKKILNATNLYLLGHLYDSFGLTNKNKIKETVSSLFEKNHKLVDRLSREKMGVYIDSIKF